SRCIRWDSVRFQIVDLDQSDPDGVVLPTDNGSVAARLKCRDNGGFAIIARSHATSTDLILLSAPPIIIFKDHRSVAVKQLQNRILQCVLNASASQRWPNCANNDPRRLITTNNETSDHHIVARLDLAAGGT